jgi:ribA/ribD-fused uncharacterized protein
MSLEAITVFDGEFAFLSNFFPCQIIFEGRVFQSSEHLFMSFKQESEEWKDICASSKFTPGQIKRKARKVELRSDWEEIKVDCMRKAVMAKFSQSIDLKEKLLATSERELIEGTTWGDKVWGICLKTGEGENKLGKILMEVRTILSKE